MQLLDCCHNRFCFSSSCFLVTLFASSPFPFLIPAHTHTHTRTHRNVQTYIQTHTDTGTHILAFVFNVQSSHLFGLLERLSQKFGEEPPLRQVQNRVSCGGGVGGGRWEVWHERDIRAQTHRHTRTGTGAQAHAHKHTDTQTHTDTQSHRITCNYNQQVMHVRACHCMQQRASSSASGASYQAQQPQYSGYTATTTGPYAQPYQQPPLSQQPPSYTQPPTSLGPYAQQQHTEQQHTEQREREEAERRKLEQERENEKQLQEQVKQGVHLSSFQIQFFEDAHTHTHMHTYTHMHTHTHTHMHTYTHIHTHAHTRTCIHTRTHTRYFGGFGACSAA